MSKLLSTDKSLRALRPSCTWWSWWTTSSTTSWVEPALLSLKGSPTVLTGLMMLPEVSLWVGLMLFRCWTSSGLSGTCPSKHWQHSGWIRWSRSVAILKICKFTAAPRHENKFLWGARLLGHDQADWLLSTFLCLVMPAGLGLWNCIADLKLESPKNVFTKEAWLLTVGRDTTCFWNSDMIKYFSFSCLLLNLCWWFSGLISSLLHPLNQSSEPRNQLRSEVANFSKSGVVLILLTLYIIFILLFPYTVFTM